MVSRGLVGLVMGAALLEGAAPPISTSSTLDFVAITRADNEVWILEGTSGTLWSQSGKNPPVRVVTLSRSADASDWSDVTGIAAVPGGWMIAGRKGRLSRYAASGEFLREVDVRDRVGRIVLSGKTLWAAPYIVPGPARHLLASADGDRFTRVLLQTDRDDVIGTGSSGLLDGATILASDVDEGVVVARLIGAPFAFRIGRDGSRRSIPLAYRRSARRDALMRYGTSGEVLTAYSSPARDLLVTPDGALLVLRNIEDVRTPTGHDLRVATIVDRYARNGRHEASAELAGQARFIARAEGNRVVCISADGRVLAAPFGPSLKGGIQ